MLVFSYFASVEQAFLSHLTPFSIAPLKVLPIFTVELSTFFLAEAGLREIVPPTMS